MTSRLENIRPSGYDGPNVLPNGTFIADAQVFVESLPSNFNTKKFRVETGPLGKKVLAVNVSIRDDGAYLTDVYAPMPVFGVVLPDFYFKAKPLQITFMHKERRFHAEMYHIRTP